MFASLSQGYTTTLTLTPNILVTCTHTGGWPVWVLEVFRFSRPAEGCREERLHLKGSVGMSGSSLEAHMAISSNVMKVEHTIVLCVVSEVFSKVNGSYTHL